MIKIGDHRHRVEPAFAVVGSEDVPLPQVESTVPVGSGSLFERPVPPMASDLPDDDASEHPGDA